MILFIILMVLFESMLFRPVRHYGGWFGYRPHHHHYYGYGPMGYRPMHGPMHHRHRGPEPGHRF